MTLTLQDYLAIGFTVGLTIIYVPQYYKIIRMKSSMGFHPWFLFLGYMASTLSCINAVIYYWATFWVSIDWSPYIDSISGFILLVFQWFLFLLFYVVFIKYFRNEHIILPTNSLLSDPIFSEDDFFADESAGISEVQEVSGIPEVSGVPLVYSQSNPAGGYKTCFPCIGKSIMGSSLAMRTKKSNIILFFLAQIVGIISLLITISLLVYPHPGQTNPDWIHIWSTILEIATLIMFCAHYAPQIWETVRLRHVGSLSLITLGIMCPGTFVWTYFLANQSNASLSIWIPYLSVGIMQTVLLSIGIYYEIRDRNNLVSTTFV